MQWPCWPERRAQHRQQPRGTGEGYSELGSTLDPKETSVRVRRLTRRISQSDSIMLHQSDAKVRVVFCDPETSADRDLVRTCDKSVLSERKKDTTISGSMVYGRKVLNGSTFVDGAAREARVRLLHQVHGPLHWDVLAFGSSMKSEEACGRAMKMLSPSASPLTASGSTGARALLATTHSEMRGSSSYLRSTPR